MISNCGRRYILGVYYKSYVSRILEVIFYLHPNPEYHRNNGSSRQGRSWWVCDTLLCDGSKLSSSL